MDFYRTDWRDKDLPFPDDTPISVLEARIEAGDCTNSRKEVYAGNKRCLAAMIFLADANISVRPLHNDEPFESRACDLLEDIKDTTGVDWLPSSPRESFCRPTLSLERQPPKLDGLELQSSKSLPRERNKSSRRCSSCG